MAEDDEIIEPTLTLNEFSEVTDDLDVVEWLDDDDCTFKSLWARSRELEADDCSTLIDVTVEIAKKIGVEGVLEIVEEEIVRGQGCDYMELVMPAIRSRISCSVEGKVEKIVPRSSSGFMFCFALFGFLFVNSLLFFSLGFGVCLLR
ncbi:uncharacterized protein A4U43_C03F29940 [Asparagus officinalis]|uniref:Uncharacterized protein n=1 Tax=Asparagus officinalis TaxID=4686 RepID=A0A5P1FDZ9_ASPOF|nr:uncharacterized protein A4U43_C03F29940 [Asparagus officinalis]